MAGRRVVAELRVAVALVKHTRAREGELQRDHKVVVATGRLASVCAFYLGCATERE